MLQREGERRAQRKRRGRRGEKEEDAPRLGAHALPLPIAWLPLLERGWRGGEEGGRGGDEGGEEGWRGGDEGRRRSGVVLGTVLLARNTAKSPIW